MADSGKQIRRKLLDVYTLLRSHFGYAERWWPGTPLEITLTAMLVQQCDWSAAWKAVCRLRAEGLLSLERLATAGTPQVQACIGGVTFAPTKSGRLVELAQTLRAWKYRDIQPFLATSRDTSVLRNELLLLKGVGEETADCILLFASEHPSFVVDAYTCRAFRRLNVFPKHGTTFWDMPYGKLKHFFETHLYRDLALYDGFQFAPDVPRPVALFRDYHAQLVELGKHHCLKRGPHCHTQGKSGWHNYDFCRGHCRSGTCPPCPLVTRCETGSATSAQQKRPQA